MYYITHVCRLGGGSVHHCVVVGLHGVSQIEAVNLQLSLAATTLALSTVLMSMHWVFGLNGAWAIHSGLLHLDYAVRLWKTADARWTQTLSGVQSALAEVSSSSTVQAIYLALSMSLRTTQHSIVSTS
ncbi:hypothetical protein GGS21DRAFT_413408 [Xylaria nigripes]|nr:hypothetical protein GGS21DRAFT_413408 [Xylaria nigripes]